MIPALIAIALVSLLILLILIDDRITSRRARDHEAYVQARCERSAQAEAVSELVKANEGYATMLERWRQEREKSLPKLGESAAHRSNGQVLGIVTTIRLHNNGRNYEHYAYVTGKEMWFLPLTDLIRVPDTSEDCPA